MAGKVQGKNVILSIHDGSTYLPVGCATNCTISVDTELFSVTTINSGVWRQFMPRFNEWSVSCEGVTVIVDATKYLPLTTITEQVRQQGVDFQIVFTDPTGQTKTFEGFGYITHTDVDSQYGDFSNFSFEIKGSGEFTLDTTPTPGEFSGMTIDFEGDGVTTIFSDAALISVNLLLAFVDGIEREIVTAGSPTGSQVKYDSSAGSIEFASAPADEVRINLLYEP